MSEDELLEFCELLCERLEEIKTGDAVTKKELDKAYDCFLNITEYLNSKGIDISDKTIKSVNT